MNCDRCRERIAPMVALIAVVLGFLGGVLPPVVAAIPQTGCYTREGLEPKITLRRLLDSTAGIPAEAPLGNGFEPASATSFEDHVQSLYGSWLVCPVGRSFSFSNVSFDLAAYLIRKAADKQFKDYLEERLFAPLGMSHTTADRQEILADPERAIGHMMGITIQEKDGFLCLTESKFFQMVNGVRSVNENLQEVRPGVFSIKGGGTLDFTREVPTWCNYRLQKK